jgi:hypothetical protein
MRDKTRSPVYVDATTGRLISRKISKGGSKTKDAMLRSGNIYKGIHERIIFTKELKPSRQRAIPTQPTLF